MGSLRPSRSDAEIRQGSFSPCLVVGRPKSGKSRLVCFSRAAGLSARLAQRRGDVACGRLVPDHKTIADCRKENGGSASAFAPAQTRWLGNDKVVIAPKVGLEWRAGTYFAIPAARASFGKSRILRRLRTDYSISIRFIGPIHLWRSKKLQRQCKRCSGKDGSVPLASVIFRSNK